ncbi:unnamed protein product [Withania somnifera]
MASVFSSSINGSTSLSTTLMCSSSSFYKPIVAKMGQNQSYWDFIERDIEAHLKKVILIRTPESVYEPMHYLTFATPKSTAPALCVAACELVGGDRAQAMPAASAVHLMHVAAYAHQHIQVAAKPGPVVGHEPCPDNELLAFGSEHAKALSPARTRVIEPEIVHKFGPNIELLTGDGIMPFAIELLAKTMSNNNDNIPSIITQARSEEGKMYKDLTLNLGDERTYFDILPTQEQAAKAMSPTRIDADKLLRVIIEVTRAMGSKGMVEGRYREVEWTQLGGSRNEELLEHACKKKEGEIHACGAACGAILGNGSDEEVESLRKYGLYVGMIQGIVNGSIGRNYNKKRMEKRVEELRVLAMKELNTNFKGKKRVKQIASLVQDFLMPISNC